MSARLVRESWLLAIAALGSVLGYVLGYAIGSALARGLLL